MTVMSYIVYYYDAFGREMHDEVEASSVEDAIETVQTFNRGGLYIPEIISVEKQGN